MYRIARGGVDTEQTGLEVSEYGLLIARPWFRILVLLQMLRDWGHGRNLKSNDQHE